ncbi:MAG TPA: Hsp20/alpha crystallin family protein [Polyangia bacterium]
MRPSNLELMHDHVRAIHRAVTGSDPPEPSTAGGGEHAPTFERVAGDFAELEALARALPTVAERVPPFSFAPPFDLIGTERELVVELGVPGVDRESVDATLDEDRLIVTGARSISAALDGRIYLHAELPRGPFRREVRLPGLVAAGRARVEVDNGIVRVRVAKPIKSSLPQA